MITTIQQTVTAALYASGNAVGGKITLSNLFPAGSEYNCAITDVVLIDKAAQSVGYNLIFFDADLAGTVTDKTAYAVSAADLLKSQGHLALGGLVNLGASGGIITSSNIYKRLTLTGPSGYAVLVTTGAPTYASTSDILLRITTEKVYV
jgi:hypothetical protein